MTSLLTNLIANARRFSDNGVGFDMVHAGKLFQVFKRLYSSSQFEDTGIGLATMKQIIDMHHGEM